MDATASRNGMLLRTALTLLLVIGANAVQAQAPTPAPPAQVVYRAVMEAPDVVKQDGGFIPRAQQDLTRVQAAADYSLYNHVQGSSSGNSRPNSIFVSTTSNLGVAQRWVTENYGGNGWVYVISPTPNFIDAAGTLRQFYNRGSEYELAAMGNIYWQQIYGWYQIDFGRMGPLILNRDFDRARYGATHDGGGQPQLAGFPPGFAAWRLDPWRPWGTCAVYDLKREPCQGLESPEQAVQRYLSDQLPRM
ncbi:enterotoxin A family protein [Lysobacter auxotrophicus]|uniref:Heat-labile enterotoxin subunit alpha n=1 Tax=Lysobacter auxotrophicus TaxID=2992573 RepID=A0ABM8DE75_9GAMM|nr:enterotoxin A family protein [Lysobacter auxotrophicus]BDU16919.1 heat-labile enterotoxin subunit alpha [Lysobacter auxotrophicus]